MEDGDVNLDIIKKVVKLLKVLGVRTLLPVPVGSHPES